ncbi:MAG: 3',5'-cyclic AMP phosphodiesterase CpdA [Planctomycetota bacterium]|jgi:3',5'-cyclic AMP phosphodiesterase CpdA
MRRLFLLLTLCGLAYAGASFGPRPASRDLFWTDRPDAQELALPEQTESFTFGVFGDRTGGPAEGVRVLRDAVDEVNLLGPDLVMTVGDLIQGYSESGPWVEQMHEYKGIMDQLDCAWFPVAGNHDVYWRGPDGQRPEGENESLYEEHFGPLWYGFRHKDSAFLVLYTDEGAPDGRAKTFSNAESQRLSAEQFSWLDESLTQVANARHVFVFLHHPRWLEGGYGDDWKHVHDRLVAAGNVTAVFAGHIHRMRYDGLQDGIEYFTLATVGGNQGGYVPEAGWLHHYAYVTVRGDGIDVVSYPVGSADDPRSITGKLGDVCRVLARDMRVEVSREPAFEQDGSLDASFELSLNNPSEHRLEVVLTPRSDDSRWHFNTGPRLLRIAPGESGSLELNLLRTAGALDTDMHLPQVDIEAVVAVSPKVRIALPLKTQTLALDRSALAPPAVAPQEGVLQLDGSAHASVPHKDLHLPDGAFTVEALVNPANLTGNQGILQKTESSEFGLMLNAGSPKFLVHLNGKYVSVENAEMRLESGVWSHVAGVFDGSELRLYVNGKLVAATAAGGKRTLRNVPLVIGGDPANGGAVRDLLRGSLDEVRISSVARYSGGSFAPAPKHESDSSTVLLLHMDARRGPWLWDWSDEAAHATCAGGAEVVPALQ